MENNAITDHNVEACLAALCDCVEKARQNDLKFEQSNMAIGFYFAQAMYGWDDPTYSTAFSMAQGLSTLCNVPFAYLLLNVFHIGDAGLGIASALSYIATYVVLGIAWKEWMFYLAYGFYISAGNYVVVVRSRISKVASSDDIGILYGLNGSTDALAPVISALVYTYLFKYFLSLFPGMVYEISAALALVPLGVAIWCATQSDDPPSYDETKTTAMDSASTV